MEPISDTEVLIIGAGPTGLSLACQLIRHGVDFEIIDTKQDITPFSKAIGVQARTLEIYEQIDIAEPLIRQGTQAEGLHLWQGGEMRGEIRLDNLGQGLSPYPYLLIVEQNKHEQILYEFLKKHGRSVEWQSELVNFTQDAKGVKAQIQTSAGDIKIIQAKYLAGCDGAKSIVRHELDLKFEGNTFERLFYVADVSITGTLDHHFVHVFLAQSTITAFFPIKGGTRYRIVGTFPEDQAREESQIIYDEIEQQILKDTKLTLDITEVHWFSTYKVHSRHVNKFSEGHCFLAGDAAHIHTPAGAQGMNTGIQDSYNLAWKLALAVKGKANQPLLDSYNEERLENAKHLLKTTDRMFDFGATPDPIIAYLRTHVLPHVAGLAMSTDAVKNLVFPLISQIGINYPHSVLSEANHEIFHIKAGDRMPYFTLPNGSIYDELRQPRFHWLVFTNDPINLIRAKMETIDTALIDFHQIPLSPPITEIFGTDQPFHLLLRPDNYIVFIAPKTSVSEVKAYFNKVGIKCIAAGL